VICIKCTVQGCVGDDGSQSHLPTKFITGRYHMHTSIYFIAVTVLPDCSIAIWTCASLCITTYIVNKGWLFYSQLTAPTQTRQEQLKYYIFKTFTSTIDQCIVAQGWVASCTSALLVYHACVSAP